MKLTLKRVAEKSRLCKDTQQQLKTVRNLRKSDKAKIKELEAKEPEIKVVEKEVIKEIPVVKEVEKVVTKEVEDTSKIAALEQHLKNTKSILSDYIKRNKELKKQVSKEVSSEADTEKIAELEALLQKRREEAEDRESYLESMHSKALAKKDEELEKIKAENDTLTQEKNVSRRDIDDLKANFEAEKREIKEISEKELKAEMPKNFKIVDFVKHLINTIKQWKEAYNTLKAENEELKAENAELRSEADKRMQKDFSKMTENLKKANQNIQKEELK